MTSAESTKLVNLQPFLLMNSLISSVRIQHLIKNSEIFQSRSLTGLVKHVKSTSK